MRLSVVLVLTTHSILHYIPYVQRSKVLLMGVLVNGAALCWKGTEAVLVVPGNVGNICPHMA